MKLVHPMIEQHIVLNENIINVLVVENSRLLSELIIDLKNQTEGKDGKFVLSNDGNIKHISKNVVLVLNIFSIDINERKILNKLYQQLQEISVNEKYYLDTINLKATISKFIISLEEDLTFDIDYEQEFSMVSLFKASNVKIYTENSSIIENIIEYIKVIEELINDKLFIFINLKSFLSNDDIQELYKFVCYNKTNILLLENKKYNKEFPEEKVIIIDNDLCEI